MKTYRLFRQLDLTGLEATRRYVDGSFNREQTIQWLMKYRLRNRERVEKSMGMIEKYQSYLVNVTYGRKFVSNYINRRFSDPSPENQWRAFEELILNPRPASSY